MRSLLLFCCLLVFAGCSDQVKGKKAHFIGRDPTWYAIHEEVSPPDLTAFTNALVEQIAKTEHIELDLVNVGSAQLFQPLELEEVGGVLSVIEPDVVSKGKYSFSDPLLLLGPVLVVREDSEAHSLEDLSGKIVAVNQYDESVLIAQSYPSLVIALYQSKAEALTQLKEGGYDGVLISNIQAQSLVNHFYPSALKIVTKPLSNKGIRLVTLKERNKSLINHFNHGLAALIKSGEYRGLMKSFPVAKNDTKWTPCRSS